jgi:8-oxo-dGTP pyrophosphatase MutT (NUDIX family)
VPAPPAVALLRSLGTIEPRSLAEAADRDRLVALAGDPGPWNRSLPLHLTASAIVVHPPTRRVLLRWHERHEAWMQVGGHGDPGETDPFTIALREAEEETGLTDLRPWPDGVEPRIVHAVIVPVPANEKEPAHEHGDLRYVLATDDPDSAVPETDETPLRWLDIADAMTLVTEDNLRENIHRAGELFA